MKIESVKEACGLLGLECQKGALPSVEAVKAAFEKKKKEIEEDAKQQETNKKLAPISEAFNFLMGLLRTDKDLTLENNDGDRHPSNIQGFNCQNLEKFNEDFQFHLTRLLNEDEPASKKAQTFYCTITSKNTQSTASNSTHSALWKKPDTTASQTLKIFQKQTELCRISKKPSKTNEGQTQKSHLSISIFSSKFWFGNVDEIAKTMVAALLASNSRCILDGFPKSLSKLDKRFEELCIQEGIIFLRCTPREVAAFNKMTSTEENAFIEKKINLLYPKPEDSPKKQAALDKALGRIAVPTPLPDDNGNQASRSISM